MEEGVEISDKTFRQAVEELGARRFPLSVEELREQVLSLSPVIQQGIADGRPIASVVERYFPEEAMQQTVTAIYRAILLRAVLDESLTRGYLSKSVHDECVRFVYDLIGPPADA